MDIKKEREAFENWAIKASGGWASFSKSHGDTYANDKLQFAWQAWQAQAVPKGNDLFGAILDVVQKLGSGEFVLLKNDSKTIVAIEQMVEQQVEASGMDSRSLERLDGEKILQAAIEAQEST